MEDLKYQVEVEKKDNERVIPYKFAILENYPQHIVLVYIPRQNAVREFIKVKPSGYWFHKKSFTSVHALVNYFKQNFKDTEYRKYVKQVKSPRQLTQEETKARRLE